MRSVVALSVAAVSVSFRLLNPESEPGSGAVRTSRVVSICSGPFLGRSSRIGGTSIGVEEFTSRRVR